ncbi:hypothetical protein JXQ70_09260 [bacterium]|nr:hypothetical protein [bacterium]
MRRTSVVKSGLAFEAITSAFTIYGYNPRNELTASNRYLGDNIGNTD